MLDAKFVGLGRVLVIAPHPDDEVLGAGGTIARLAAAGQDVFVAVVTSGKAPRYSAESVQIVKNEALEAHRLLGVRQTFWLDYPAGELDTVPHGKVNDGIGRLVADLSPDTLLLPFTGDIHLDHQLVFLSSLVAARPHTAHYPQKILAYETLSETNWNAPYLTPGFQPNVFIPIERTLERKLKAMECFRSQLRTAPHERSVAVLEALATLRGSTIHRSAAEGFVLIREVI